MWVGRATVFLVGLSVILALVFGIATTAVAGDGPGAVFNLGQKYTVNRLSQLVGTTALDLKVGKGTDPTTKTAPPMKVDSQAEVANLNAEFAGTADNAAHADSADSAGQASTALTAEKLDGKTIDELPGAVVQAVNVTGEGSTVPFGSLTFVAPPVTVTTSSTQRLVGVISASLKLDSGGPLTFNYGLCYRQANSSAPLVNFSGPNHPQGTATTTSVTWTAAATKVPGVAGTWDVGFCVQNASDQFVTLRGDGKVSGWIEVVNPTP